MTFEQFEKNVNMIYVAHTNKNNVCISFYKSEDCRFGMIVFVRKLKNGRYGMDRTHWTIGSKTFTNKKTFTNALKSIDL